MLAYNMDPECNHIFGKTYINVKIESEFWKDYSLTENMEILEIFRKGKKRSSFLFGLGWVFFSKVLYLLMWVGSEINMQVHSNSVWLGSHSGLDVDFFWAKFFQYSSSETDTVTRLIIENH